MDNDLVFSQVQARKMKHILAFISRSPLSRIFHSSFSSLIHLQVTEIFLYFLEKEKMPIFKNIKLLFEKLVFQVSFSKLLWHFS